jgi:hypothetical protein
MPKEVYLAKKGYAFGAYRSKIDPLSSWLDQEPMVSPAPLLITTIAVSVMIMTVVSRRPG